MFDLYWLNCKRTFVTVDQTYSFLHLLQVGQEINHVYTVAIKLEIYVMPLSCHSTSKYITYMTVLHTLYIM